MAGDPVVERDTTPPRATIVVPAEVVQSLAMVTDSLGVVPDLGNWRSKSSLRSQSQMVAYRPHEGRGPRATLAGHIIAASEAEAP